MSQLEYESIPVQQREAYLERAAAVFNEIGPQVELEAIGATPEQMAYVGRLFARSAEYMLSLPSEEQELQAIERNAGLGTATLPEYIIGLICAGEENGSISEPSAMPDSWFGI